MKNLVLITLAFLVNLTFTNAQVLDAGNPDVAAALSNAQVEGSPLSNAFQRRTPMMDKMFRDVKDNGNFEYYYVGAEVGSAYETENFAIGQVFYENEFLGKFYYRHNAFSNEVEVKRTLLEEEKHKALVKNEKVYLLSQKGQKMQFLSFFNRKNVLKEGYLTLLFEGENYSLHRRLRIKFSEAKPAANSMVNPIPSKFTQYTEYYIQKKGADKIVELPGKKSKFLKHFEGSKGGEIAALIKEKELDISSEKDLIQLFTFADSLK